MDAAQRARLRALAEKARDTEAAYRALPNTAPTDDVLRLGRARNNASHDHEHAASPDTVLALLDALDSAERERDEAHETTLQQRIELAALVTKAEAEGDALAALLRDVKVAREGHYWTQALTDRIEAALDAAKGNG